MADLRGLVRADPGYQRMGAVVVQGLGQSHDLIDGLVQAENHLRKSVAEMAVVVQIGKAHVLKRQVYQGFHSLIRGQTAVGHLLQ